MRTDLHSLVEGHLGLCCGNFSPERFPTKMWTPQPSFGVLAATVFTSRSPRPARTASKSSWNKHGGCWSDVMSVPSWCSTTISIYFVEMVWLNAPHRILIESYLSLSRADCRQSKPRNRPSFRQILLHLDIASADVLGAPQETYFKSQVSTATAKRSMSAWCESQSSVHF